MNPKHSPHMATVPKPKTVSFDDKSQKQIEQMRSYIEGLESRLHTATKSSVK